VWDVDVVEGDGVASGFDKGACKGGAEVRRLACEERGVNEEGGGFRADEEGGCSSEVGWIGSVEELVDCLVEESLVLGTGSLACWNVPKLPSA
jgi:hypothetical protein